LAESIFAMGIFSSKRKGNGGLSVQPRSASSGSSKIPATVKVVLLGDVGVGKTSLLLRYVTNTFANEISSDHLEKQVTIDGQPVTLELWDTRGQERFRTVTSSYYRKTGAAVIIFDVTDLNSFESIPAWRHEIARYAGEETPTIIVATKCDVADKRVIPQDEIARCAKNTGCPVFEASAKEGTSVDQVFNALCDLIKAHYSKAAKPSMLKESIVNAPV